MGWPLMWRINSSGLRSAWALPSSALFKVGHIGGMVLAVVDFHRFGIDVGLQRIVRIREFGQGIGHQ